MAKFLPSLSDIDNVKCAHLNLHFNDHVSVKFTENGIT